MKNIYIPISFNCNAAIKLKDSGLKNTSYCFDWNIKTINSVYLLIEDNFKDLFNTEYLVYGNKKYNHKYDNDEKQYKDLIPVYNKKYNILFVHDFANDSIEEYNIIYNKYIRRIKRFIEDISNKSNNIIIIYDNVTDEYNNNIYTNWNNYFNNNNIFNYLITNKIEYLSCKKKIEDLIILLKKKYLNENISIKEINSL